MGTKYTTILTGGEVATYNDSPPSDDGAQTEANRVKFATITSDLTAPLHSAITNMDAKLLTQVDEGPLTKATTYTTVAGDYAKTIECSSTFTLSLLNPSGEAGYKVTAKNAGAGTITVDVDGGANIDGVASITLAAGESRECRVNAAGTGYYSTSSFGDPLTLAVGAADTFLGSDGTDPGWVAGASAAEQEAATETGKPVTPSVQHFNPAHPKLVFRFTGVETPVVTSLFTSGASDPTVVRNAIGRFTITFNEEFDAAPVVVVTGLDTVANQVGGGVELSSNTTTECNIRSTDKDGVNVDYDEYHMAIWGNV